MKNTNLLIPKTLGFITISAVLIIGVYVLIIDLPTIKKETNADSSNQNVALINDNSQNITDTSSSSLKNTTPGVSNENTSQNTTNSTTPSSTTAPATPTSPATPITPTDPAYSYRNGSFASSKSYSVPGNKTNTLTATITISNDTVVGISTSSINDAKSQEYNDGFKAEVSAAVIGKKIDPLSVNVLGGASLTSSAFNTILEQIRNNSKK